MRLHGLHHPHRRVPAGRCHRRALHDTEFDLRPRAEQRMRQLEALLRRQDKRVCGAGRVDNVFHSAEDVARQTFDDAYLFGSSRSGLVHCIVTGSSSVLRQLCFARLPRELLAEYPGYAKKDMNDTKYIARWMYPFLSEKDFYGALQLLGRKGLGTVAAGEGDKMFLHTGGNIRRMELYLQFAGRIERDIHIATAAEELLREDPRLSVPAAVFVSVHAAITNMCKGRAQATNEDSFVFAVASRVPFCTVWERAREWHPKLEEGEIVCELRTLADRGLIVYERQLGNTVGFASPLVYIDYRCGVHVADRLLSSDDAAAAGLECPCSTVSPAERSVEK